MQHLLRLGMPLGPNHVVTIRGRKSGRPQHVPLAITEVNGRRWVIGAYGETNWVRNLRAAGEADVEIGGSSRRLRAVELTTDEAADFFRDVLIPYATRMPQPWRFGVRLLFGMAAPEVLNDPDRAAQTRPVFELLDG
jgi:deazaflavin-dependent oxidoreductase (nitroreductase family)